MLTKVISPHYVTIITLWKRNFKGLSFEMRAECFLRKWFFDYSHYFTFSPLLKRKHFFIQRFIVPSLIATYFSLFHNSPLGKWCGPSFEKITKDAQVWLEFRSRAISEGRSLSCYYLPWEKSIALHLYKLESPLSKDSIS